MSKIEVVNLDEEQQNVDWIMSSERRREYIGELWPPVAEKPVTEGGKPRPQPPGVKTAKVPLDKQGSVLLILSQTREDIARTAGEIFKMSRSAYDAALMASIAELGCSGNAHLTGGPELKALRERSKWSAESIAKTYHKDLVHILEGAAASWREAHNGTEEGMTRLWLAKQARAALDIRWKWKEPQIAITEKAFAVDRARLDFWWRNQVDGEVRVMPLAAVCEFCQAYIDRGWVSLREAEKDFQLPRHVSCPHFLQLRARKDSIPRCEDLWRGGTKAKYAREGWVTINGQHVLIGEPGDEWPKELPERTRMAVIKAVGVVRTWGEVTNTEMACGLNDQGEMVGDLVPGTKGSVWTQSLHEAGASIIIHNHTNNTPFGYNDVESALAFGHISVVVGINGDVFILKRGAARFPWGEATKSYESYAQKLMPTYQERANRGEDHLAMNAEMLHEVMLRLSADFDMTYVRARFKHGK